MPPASPLSLSLDTLKTKLLAYKAEHDKATGQTVQLEAQLAESRMLQRRLEGAMGAVNELIADLMNTAEPKVIPAPAAPPLPGDVMPKGEG